MAGRRPTNAREQRARVEQERLRLHTARRDWHTGTVRRRVRDNTIAVVAGSLIVIAAVVSQVVHAQVTAPAPKPTPTVTSTPTAPAPSAAPGTPAPSPAP
ncbi:hypothetical protein [Microbacterium capsulatum]|uniref:Dioxygenase n=1 Tax=Microbacterium capsulatum TaxID=3041921 RepID=A0ABU0XCE4_9MICO|nr:hypothetical protein [Microbacterium sp. ASV81]MDQ4212758.1 hypothetical protein [Microbacterium sp. ASV81]